MHVIKGSLAPVFELPGLRVTGLAAPSRGATENCVWRLTLAPHTPSTPHAIDREEIFVALSGEAQLDIAGRPHVLAAGDALVVPAGETLLLANPGPQPFTAVAVLPVGGQAVMANGQRIIPPWTL